MLRFPSSIRQKIRLGYYAIVVLIVGLLISAFMELRFVERKVMLGEAISEFFDATLEIRRFEKNYFLYGKDEDYQENIRYVTKAHGLLEDNIKGFRSIAAAYQISALQNDLKQYKELMEQYSAKVANINKTSLEGEIRKTGKDIITIAEDISKAERKNLQTMLYNSQRILIFSVIFLSILVIVIGQIILKMIIKPLKELEKSMEIIADGAYRDVNINSKDREIISLTNAFNKMLHELELRQRHLVQSEKLASLGTLLSGVAHELNNPLSNISSSCQILMEEIKQGQGSRSKGKTKSPPALTSNNPAFLKELLSQIDEQTDRARNIVRSLLEFSRDKEFEKEHLPLKRLIKETIRFIRGQLPIKVEIEIDIPDDIAILADKQRIQQAFLNLIKNAAEAINAEGKISIMAQKVMSAGKKEEGIKTECQIEGDSIDIEISDTGSGIPSEVLPKIFDPFFTTKDVGKGSGLGLFIVHEIIEEHDGCIAVDSEIGKGTTFLIRLPIKE
ncbi:MAG: HAMP domain-containing protein [Nitrospirae bacterium]|nr:HAMP domain-containing protein [Nitrospirota bacterium]